MSPCTKALINALVIMLITLGFILTAGHLIQLAIAANSSIFAALGAPLLVLSAALYIIISSVLLKNSINIETIAKCGIGSSCEEEYNNFFLAWENLWGTLNGVGLYLIAIAFFTAIPFFGSIFLNIAAGLLLICLGLLLFLITRWWILRACIP